MPVTSRSVLGSAAVLGAVALAVLLWPREPGTIESGPAVPAVTTPPATAETAAIPDGYAGSPRPEDPARAAVQQRIADLEQALAAAIELRRQAETALDASEREVEELEAYVADIESRGEDPVDYAEDGMERFQPAFFRYQDAAAAYADAEALEAEARAALDEARTALAALDAGAATR